MRLDLPPTALGKDYLAPRSLFAVAPSGTGWQFSLFGLFARRLGITARSADSGTRAAIPLPERMANGLAKFKGPVLLIMSGQDLTAREFEDSAGLSATWRRLLGEKRVTRRDLQAADHTFSRRTWHDKVVEWTSEWVRNS